MGILVNKVTQRQIFCFPLSNTIPPVLHTHLSPRPDPKGQFKTADGISGIATRLRDGSPGGSKPDSGQRKFSSPKCPNRVWNEPCLSFSPIRGKPTAM